MQGNLKFYEPKTQLISWTRPIRLLNFFCVWHYLGIKISTRQGFKKVSEQFNKKNIFSFKICPNLPGRVMQNTGKGGMAKGTLVPKHTTTLCVDKTHRQTESHTDREEERHQPTIHKQTWAQKLNNFAD